MNAIAVIIIVTNLAYTAAFDTVRVVTFPIFADGTNRMGRVSVPDAFAKVAFGAFGAALWVMPNK